MNENIECETRYGHCEGHTDCAFIDHQRLMTCGVDSEARIWPIDGTQIEDYVEGFPICNDVYAVVCNSTHFFVACDSNSVLSYDINDGENETTVCRFETNATHLDISSDGKILVASAADFTLKMVNLETNEQKSFEGHDAPVLSVALDPKLRYIASSSCDSSVRIWSIDNKNCVHFWTNCFPKSNDFGNSQTLGRICWQPIDGQLIAIPKMDRIEIFRRDDWNLMQTFKHEKLNQISIVSYSFDAKYLAVSSNEGIIMIWDTNSNDRPIAQFFNKTKKITSLKWNPKSSTDLSFGDIGGKFGALRVTGLSSKEQIELSQDDINDLFSEITDEDFVEPTEDKTNEKVIEEDFSLEKIEFNPKYKQQIVKRVQSLEKEDKDNEVTDNNGNEVVENNDNKVVENNDNKVVENNDNEVVDNNEDVEEFDISAIKSKYESQIFRESDDLVNDKVVENRPDSRLSATSEPKLQSVAEDPPPLRQEPFQPGSTPVHLENRFMVWNSVGIVRCTDTENENSIDVEFHDTTYHHSIHLPNVQNYSIADLSNETLILATNGDESAVSGKLFCMLLNIWDSTKEWQIVMPNEEFIEAIGCGTGFIAVATDKRFVRIFTSGGIQTDMFSISGRVVCLAAFEHFLMIIYHSASGMPEEQSLSMYVLNVEHKLKVNHPVPNPTPVALCPKSLVSWAGFTDEGTPCVVDSDGVVRLFNRAIGNTWTPIASTKEEAKGKSNNFFVIGLSEIQSQIRCIFCKGSRYPATIPKPTLTILDIRVPLCERSTTKAKLEEEQLRNKILQQLLAKLSKSGFDVDSNIEVCNKSLISSSIKLFAMALGADRETLTEEISKLMPNKTAVEGAIKLAEKQQRRTLIVKLSQIAEQKDEEELNREEEEEEEEEIHEIRQTTHMSVNMRTDIEVEENSFQLKPKPMKTREESSTSAVNSDDSDVNDEDSNSISLKPKPVDIQKHSNINPFKVTQKESMRGNRSKRGRNSDSEDSDNDSHISQAFQRFYSEMKQIIKDDNSDVEDEEELKAIAMRQFKELDSDERKEWAKSEARPKKRKTKTEIYDKTLTDKENKSKITKFFTRN